MGEVGGEGQVAEGSHAVGRPAHEVPTTINLDVLFRCLEQVCRDLPGLVADLARCHVQRRAAHGCAPAPVRAHAVRNLRRVAMLDLDVVEGHAEFIGHDLREGGLVPLAVAVPAREDRDLPGRVHPDLTAFEEPGLKGAQLPHQPQWRETTGFDVAAEADAEVPALPAQALLLLAEAAVVDHSSARSSAGA